jgi:phosphoglycerate dehydrogenase-like enzyme
MKLVICPSVEHERLERIQEAADGDAVVNASTHDQALAAIQDADAFFGKITPILLSAAQRVRWIQAPTASLEHYMFPELVSHSVTLSNMRGIFSDHIADQVLGYILSFARNLHLYARRQGANRWEPVGGESERATFKAGPGTVSALDRATMSLAGKVIGIVGLGGIGTEIARRAVAFGMRVVAVDPRVDSRPSDVSEVWPVDNLDHLLSIADFVVIAAPHTPETVRLFDRDRLRRMKTTGYLINVGRGSIVDLEALTEALMEGQLAGAALDVFEVEPLPADHPLWPMENVIITPHVAGYAPTVATRHLGVLLDNIRRFKEGRPLANVVDKTRWF